MGLRDDLQADIAEAFDDADGLADAVASFTGSRTTVSDTYDPVTGTYPETTIGYSGRGVFGGYSVLEIDGQHIEANDVKLIALQNEVTLDAGGEAEPKIGDHITNADGEYRVVNVGKDPAAASWTAQLRKA